MAFKRRWALVIAILTVISIMIAGCTVSTQEDAKKTESSKEAAPSAASQAPAESTATATAASSETVKKQIVIGHLLYYRKDEYEVAMEKAVQAECDKRGWKLISHDADADSAKQLQQLEDLITQKVDMIMVCPVDAAGLGPTAEKAIADGIPVITYDEPLNAKGIISWVRNDDEKMGKNLAVWLKAYADKNWNGKAIVAELNLAGSTADAIRYKGFDDNIDNVNIKVVTVQDGKAQRADSMSVTENIITANPEVNVFVCSNDESALGAVQALDAVKSKAIVLSMGPWTYEAVMKLKNKDPYFKAANILSPYQLQDLVFKQADIYFARGKNEEVVYRDPLIYDQENIQNFDISQIQK